MFSLESGNPTSPSVGIVADDLTGASDSGVEFLACADSVTVLVESELTPPPEVGGGIVAYNTQSRRLKPSEAYDKVAAATRRVLSSGADVLFKKVDSAMRGNFGVELGAVMDATGSAPAFVLPAIPEAGRETIGGIQHIDGVPVSETFYSGDPEHPVVESSVLRRAEDGSGRKAGLISLQEVRGRMVVSAAEALGASGCDIVVIDARTEVDLDSAVRGLMGRAERKVFVGCQGLARALARYFPAVRELPCGVQGIAGPMFFVCGTLHPQSKRQLEFAANSGRVELIKTDVGRIGRRCEAGGGLAEALGSCCKGLSAGRDVALCLTGDVGEAPPELCGAVLEWVTGLTLRVVESVPVGALVLTGGETAYAVCRGLDIEALELRARIGPLVVASEAVGGARQGLIVVTKGGSIGPQDVVLRIQDSVGSVE